MVDLLQASALVGYLLKLQYISVLSPKHNCGRILAVFQWSISWAVLIVFAIEIGYSHIKAEESIRGNIPDSGMEMMIGLFYSSACT